MRFTVAHRTTYTYASPVHESFNEVRLQPVSDDTQTCLAFDLTIDPPATVITFHDYYGNIVHDFGIPYLHDHLEVEATSDVITFADTDVPLAGPRSGMPGVSPLLAGLVESTRKRLIATQKCAVFGVPSTLCQRSIPTSGDLLSILHRRGPGVRRPSNHRAARGDL